MNKNLKCVSFCALTLLLVLPSCAPRKNLPSPPSDTLEPKAKGSAFYEFVLKLPPNAEKSVLDEVMPTLLSELFSSPASASNEIEKALESLRGQANIVISLQSFYERTTGKDERHFIISVLGELRRTDGLELLNRIAWTDLPPQRESHYLTAREREEAIQAKAVEGMAYLRTEEGDRRVYEVISSHPSKYVRATAIQAFLWNHGDGLEATKLMLDKARPEDAKYIELTRYNRSVITSTFNENLKRWREKYWNGE